MRMKVSDYIAQFWVDNGIKTVFTVVGGGAMHMNDSFGHHPKLHCVYNHHEQASAMAAEAYFRVNNEMAGLCVTSGPGAINALNGVAGAYQDSIPMIVVSGQCKSTLTVRRNGLNLRTLGPQEFDIVSTLDNITKYAETIFDPKDIRYCLEKAFYIAGSGRPGPCWLDIPVDIQGSFIETDELRGYTIEEAEADAKADIDSKINSLISRLKNAERPVIYAGNGIRIAGGEKELHQFVHMAGIPVVTCWDSIDLMATDDKYYAGRGGTMGDRAGNFAVQNSDVLLTIGSRLNIYQVGYELESWAREAYVAVVDIDPDELTKPTIRVDLPICYDAKKFLLKLISSADRIQDSTYSAWVQQCNLWKKKYPVVSQKQKEQEDPINVYAFIDELSKNLPDGMITVVANGSASVVGSQTYHIRNGQRFIMNCGISSMGYDLPAAIGACMANDKKPVVCIAGDGSIQMNIQELQTIVTNNLPIKIIVINNEGYQQIRITQTNLFNADFVGIGPVSNDLGFPDFGKLADAYRIPYRYCGSMSGLDGVLEWLMGEEMYCMLEVQCSTTQFFEPKSATKKLDDGTLYSPPLEDMAPFLSREELKENMYISLWDER